jgi:acyl carrier protein
VSGADILTFPRPNSRFDVATEEFVSNLKGATEPVGSILPAFPFPTGGNRAEDVAQCYSVLGNFDYGFVAGSAMFEENGGIGVGAKNLRDALETLAATHTPKAKPATSDTGNRVFKPEASITVEELFAALAPLAETVLQIPKFDHAITMVNTPEWDSLHHIQLLGSIERKFDIKISADDSFRLCSADKLIHYVHARLQEKARATYA